MEVSMIVLTALFIAVLAVEAYLSHQNGKDSGAASKSLSNRLHLSDGAIRTGAHIISFAVMTCMACAVSYLLTMAVIAWAIMDEVTKPLMKNGRHCGLIDIGWNLCGCVIGLIVWIVARFIGFK